MLISTETAVKRAQLCGPCLSTCKASVDECKDNAVFAHSQGKTAASLVLSKIQLLHGPFVYPSVKTENKEDKGRTVVSKAQREKKSRNESSGEVERLCFWKSNVLKEEKKNLTGFLSVGVKAGRCEWIMRHKKKSGLLRKPHINENHCNWQITFLSAFKSPFQKNLSWRSVSWGGEERGRMGLWSERRQINGREWWRSKG